MQALSFGTALQAWWQFALMGLGGIIVGLVIGRVVGAKVGALLAVLAVLLAAFITGRSFHQVVTTDRDVALYYAVPPRIVRLPAETIGGATWSESGRKGWVLAVTTRNGTRYLSRTVRRDQMEALDRGVIESPLGVSR